MGFFDNLINAIESGEIDKTLATFADVPGKVLDTAEKFLDTAEQQVSTASEKVDSSVQSFEDRVNGAGTAVDSVVDKLPG